MSLILNKLRVADSIMLPGTVNAVVATTANDRNLKIKGNSSSNIGIVGVGSDNAFGFQLHGDGSNSYGFLSSEWGGWDFRKLITGALYMNNNDTYYLNTTATSYINNLNLAGNVGINTTTPQTKLDVFVGANNTFAASFGHNVGAGSFSGFSFGYQEQGNLNYRKSAWVFERTDGHGQGGNASGKIHLLLRNDGASSAISLTDSVMTIDSDASGTRSSVRVGIGTTSPNAKLQVNGGMTFGYGSDAAFYTGTEFDSSKYLILQNNTDSYGRIGLAINAKTFNGANTPSANDGWAIDSPRSGIRFRAWLTGDTDYQTKFTIQHLLANAQNANGDLGIFARGYSTSSPAFLLTGAGNVGIGTTSPGHKLEVSGNALVTKLFVNSANASYDLYNNGTSYFNSTVAVNSWLYLNQNYGHSIVGLYDSTKYQGIFAMGDNYKLPAGGATTGTLYGLAWSHPNAGGVAANLNTHGMLVMENGTFLAAVSGSVRARDDMRAPIFYDSNDTGYYCNPNGASNFYDLNFGGKLAFRQLSTNTVYGPNIHWGITQPNGVKLYYDEEFEYSSNSIQVYNNNGGTAVTITRKNSSFLDGHTQVPNSTGYVLEIKHDPATSSGTSPYNGGWYFATSTGAGKAFLCVFKMKIPSGRNISFHSNNTGTNSAVSWITNLAGTGQYEDYAIIVNSGTASWSSTFFFAIDGAATLFYTYLASATVYELTNVNDKVIGGSLGVGVNSQFSNCRFSLSSGNTSRFGISDGTVTSNMWTTSSTFYISTETNHPMVFITNANERLRIAADGNVGIGTTSPSNKLEVGNFLDGVTNKIIVSARYEYEPEFNFRLGQSGTGYDWIGGVISCGDDGNYNGKILFKTCVSGRGTPTTKMAIKANGNIGIGTTSPLAKLHILSSDPTSVTSVFTNSDIIIDSNTNSYINFRQTADTGAYGGFVWTDNNHGAYIVFRNWQGSAATGGDSLIYGTYQDHIFQAGSSATINGRSEVMRILQNGNVGIGTTSPGAKLEVNGGIRLQNNYNLYWGASTGDQSAGANTPIITATQSFGFYIVPNGTTSGTTFRIAANGDVGISTGVGAPNAKLDVNGGVSTNGHIRNSWGEWSMNVAQYPNNYTTTPDYYGGLSFDTPGRKLFISNKNNDGGAVSDPNGSIIFRTGATPSERMWITYGGNVGIGTSTPSAKLEVNGVVKDQYGDLRTLPENAKTAAYTLAASDTGRLINITTGGITVPASVFSIGQVVTIYNNSASNQTITQGASVTMYLAGTATTGNRTLAQRGVATVICVASNTFVISGSGLT